MPRMYLVLPNDVWDALWKEALKNFREPRQEAAWIIKQALLPDDGVDPDLQKELDDIALNPNQ